MLPLRYWVPLLRQQDYPFVLRLFKGIRTKFVGESVVVTAAADDVAWVGVIGKDQNRFALGTADFFHDCGKRPTSFFPQPEGNAGSKRAVDDIPWLDGFGNFQRSPAFRAAHTPHVSQSQNTLEFSPIKPYDHFVIHYNNRGGSATNLLDQFFHSARIFGHVAISKRDLVVRKKLFRRTTCGSPGG